MENKLKVLLTLAFVAVLGLQTESQAYVERNDTYFVSEDGNVHDTRIGASLDDAFTPDRNSRYHTRSYCRRNPNAGGC